jgi:hypothetical protein
MLNIPQQSDSKTQRVLCEAVRTLTGSFTSSPTVLALIMQERFGSFYLSCENHWFHNTLGYVKSHKRGQEESLKDCL